MSSVSPPTMAAVYLVLVMPLAIPGPTGPLPASPPLFTLLPPCKCSSFINLVMQRTSRTAFSETSFLALGRCPLLP